MRREHLVGAGLIILGAALLIIFWNVQQFATLAADTVVDAGVDCVIDGTGCLHQKASNWFLIGAIPSALVLLAGIYVAFFLEVSEYKDQREEEAIFETMLKGLSEEQRAIMRAVKKDDGVTQATLKFRVDMSKSKLSQELSELEERNLITRNDAGRTKEVYLHS